MESHKIHVPNHQTVDPWPFSYWCLIGNFREWSTITNYHFFHPSNPQQPIYSLRKTHQSIFFGVPSHHRSPRGRLEDAFVARFHQRRPKPFLEGVLLHLHKTRPAFRGMGDVHRKTIGKPQENHRTIIGKWWFTPLNIGISWDLTADFW